MIILWVSGSHKIKENAGDMNKGAQGHFSNFEIRKITKDEKSFESLSSTCDNHSVRRFFF